MQRLLDLEPQNLRRMTLPVLLRYAQTITKHRNTLSRYVDSLKENLTNRKVAIQRKEQEIEEYKRSNMHRIARAAWNELELMMDELPAREKKFAKYKERLDDFNEELEDIDYMIYQKSLPLQDRRDLRDRELMRTHDDELAEYYDDGYETDANEYE